MKLSVRHFATAAVSVIGMLWFGSQALGQDATAEEGVAITVETDSAAEREATAVDAPPSIDRGINLNDAGDLAVSGPVTPPSPNDVLGGRKTVAVIRIEGMIYGFTLESIERRVLRAREEGADVIVLDLDTPGGTVDSAMKISRFLKSMPEMTVAWVNPAAYSAGILIASACDMIVMAPSSATGDCAPIVPGQDLQPTERAKALSPLLTEFRDNAKVNDHPYVLFHAMCVLGVKIYRVRHIENGEVRFVNEADYRYMVRGRSELDDPEPSSESPAPPVTPFAGVGSGTQTITDPSERSAWELDAGEGRPSAIVHDGQTLLTVTQDDAVQLSLADAIVGSESALKSHLQAQQVLTIATTWSETLAGVLTHPVVRAALMLALVMGAYMEFQSPGLGAPGIVAALALLTLVGAPFLIGLSEMIWVVVFAIGVLLLGLELFLIPGFGLLGFAGLTCILGALIMQVVPMDPDPSRVIPKPIPGAEGVLVGSAISMLTGLIASIIALYFLAKHFGSIPFFSRLVLDNEVANAGAALSTSTVSGSEAVGGGVLHVGQRGRVVAQLRPVGTAEIEGRIVDVVSRGAWIESGLVVKIVEVQGNRITVEGAE